MRTLSPFRIPHSAFRTPRRHEQEAGHALEGVRAPATAAAATSAWTASWPRERRQRSYDGARTHSAAASALITPEQRAGRSAAWLLSSTCQT
ncbi:hypothetical protein ON010_g252 [Phytophthora cinnamomi]|nr:hypothetical protein ON010_g252 [Phytophthora cinnamomi]